jgi:sentrin-specific protease 1
VLEEQLANTFVEVKEEIPRKKHRITKTSTPMKQLKIKVDKENVSSKLTSKHSEDSTSGLLKDKSISVSSKVEKVTETVIVGNEEIVLDWTHINDINGLSIREINIVSLSGRRWVDEMIIDAFIALQCHKIRENNHPISATYIPSTFYSIFAEEWDEKKMVFKRFMQFCVTNLIWKNDIIFIPIHLVNHWVLAVVVPKNKIIYYVDGLYKSCNKKVIKLLSVLIQILAYLSDDHANLTLAEWSCIKPQDAAKQRGDYNCGVYACVWPYIIASQKEMDFTNDAVTEFRQIMHQEITKKNAKAIIIHHNDNKTFTLPGEENSLWAEADKSTVKLEIVPNLDIARHFSLLIYFIFILFYFSLGVNSPWNL